MVIQDYTRPNLSTSIVLNPYAQLIYSQEFELDPGPFFLAAILKQKIKDKSVLLRLLEQYE